MNDTLQIIFSGVVAFSTIIYAVLTWRLVSETKKTRKIQITPDIHAYFEMSETDATFIYLIIENIGYGVAKYVKFKIIKDFQFYDLEPQQLSSKGIFKTGLKYFYPKQKFKYLFTDLSKKYDEKIHDNIEISLTYNDISNYNYKKEINLTLDEITGMGKMRPPDSYIGRIAYEIKEIRKLLESNS